MTEPPIIVLVIRWTLDTVGHEQAYGPWTAQQDESHHDEISRFLKGWNQANPDAQFTSGTLYLVIPPGETVPLETA